VEVAERAALSLALASWHVTSSVLGLTLLILEVMDHGLPSSMPNSCCPPLPPS
jgi:hypothetical protein